jgi:hypothetical protein
MPLYSDDQIGLLEQEQQLKLIALLPDVNSYLADLIEKSSLQTKSLESLIITGVLPVYFNRTD